MRSCCLCQILTLPSENHSRNQYSSKIEKTKKYIVLLSTEGPENSLDHVIFSHRVIILEDDLEKLMVAKETEEMTCAGYQELRERLQLLQPHMQASTSCWDDTLAQVDRMLRRVSSCPGQRSTSQPITAACCL